MAIVITKQPHSVAVNAGDTVYFSVEAEGDSLTYQWQKFETNSTAWVDSLADGATTNEIHFPTNTYNDGFKYRCIITDVAGNTVTTDEVTLYIIDGASSADKGLVSMSIMSDIAKAIRAKTETTDMILPADMAAMIAGIATDVAYAQTGTVTIPYSSPTLTMSLGTSLAVGENYIMVVMYVSGGSSAPRLGGFQCRIDGVGESVFYTKVSDGTGIHEEGWTINFTKGKITFPSGIGQMYGTYFWAYISGGAAA